MKKVLSLFDGIAEWKRKWIFIAFLLCIGGVLWESNDLIQENGDYFAPESGIAQMRVDEYGDPLAISKPKSLPYAKLWSNLVTRLSFCFILALVIGALIRSLVSGSVALVVTIIFTAMLVGQSAFFDLFKDPQVESGAFQEAFAWVKTQVTASSDWLMGSIELIAVGAVGFVMGIFK